MRLIYSTLFTLLLPLVFLRLYWRSIKAPVFRQRLPERLALYARASSSQVIWFHAVSVGEAEAVFPLVKRMQQRHPDADFLVTTMTPTGSARVKAVLGDSVEHVYFPYDIPFVMTRFLRIFRPRLAIIMEKEIWPNLFAQCNELNIPLFIINARLSFDASNKYKMIPSLFIPALRLVDAIMTQTQEDYESFIEIGAPAEKMQVAGNIKFDVTVPESMVEQGRLLKRQLFPGRFVWIVASTHKGEEEIFLNIYRRLKSDIPELLLLLVPRHQQRFQSVKRLTEEQGFQTIMRSGNDFCTALTDVYLADTMGELKMLYAAADIGFVGGSMVPAGGHNILEALAVGLPVMFGPHMVNFKEIAEGVLERRAALQCMNEEQIIESVKKLYGDEGFRRELSVRGVEFLDVNRGATERIASLLESYL